MTNLIVLAFANDKDAIKIRDKLVELKQARLIEVADAVSAVKKPDGKIKVQHEVRLTESASNQAMLLNLVLWLSWQEIIAGVAANPGRYVRDYIGVDDKFVKEATRIMEASHLVLFLLAATFPEGKALGQLQDFGVTLLKRDLSEQDEAVLKETFGG